MLASSVQGFFVEEVELIVRILYTADNRGLAVVFARRHGQLNSWVALFDVFIHDIYFVWEAGRFVMRVVGVGKGVVEEKKFQVRNRKSGNFRIFLPTDTDYY